MVLDPIPQSLPVHFFESRPQPPTSYTVITQTHYTDSVHRRGGGLGSRLKKGGLGSRLKKIITQTPYTDEFIIRPLHRLIHCTDSFVAQTHSLHRKFITQTQSSHSHYADKSLHSHYPDWLIPTFCVVIQDVTECDDCVMWVCNECNDYVMCDCVMCVIAKWV